MRINKHSFSITIVFFQAEYSYFSSDFRMKIFLWIFLDYSVWHFRFVDFDMEYMDYNSFAESLIWSTNITSHRQVTSTKQMASAVSAMFWDSEKGKIFNTVI